jgi:hypothetical protein
MRCIKTITATMILLLCATTVFGDPVSYQFSPNTPIRSSEINGNFQELVDRISSLESQLSEGNKAVFVGVTVEAVKGYKGVVSFNKLCHSNFPKSRICNSKEIIETADPPDFFSGFRYAWVHPVTSAGSDQEYSRVYDGMKSCQGWSAANTERGLVIRNADAIGDILERVGIFATALCNTEMYDVNVACCR